MTQVFFPIRRCEQGQHDKTERPTQFLYRFDHWRVGPTDHQDLACIMTHRERRQELVGQDAAPRQSDHDQIKRPFIEMPTQLVRLGRFANDVSELFQSVAQERPHVPVAVADASGRRHFSSTERRDGSESFNHCVISVPRTLRGLHLYLSQKGRKKGAREKMLVHP